MAELIDRPEQVAPGSSHLQVGFVHVPAVLDDLLSSPSRLRELRGEPLDPPVDAHVVDLDPAFGQQLLDVLVGEAEPQVPADRPEGNGRFLPPLLARPRRAALELEAGGPPETTVRFGVTC